MAQIRKYKHGGEKRKEKRRRKVLQKTRVGSPDRYFPKNTVENVVVDEMDIGHSDVNNATVVENQFVNDENENKKSNGIEADSGSKEDNEKLGVVDNFSFDVDDPRYQSKIENNKIEFLVERGPKRVKDVYDTSGLGLYNELVEALKVHGLDIDNIKGQRYNNGSNMKGKNKGVQTRLLKKNLRAFYTPCACHSLNLILSDKAHCYSKAVFFFGVLQRKYSLFSASTKRWKIFTDHVQGLTVKSLLEICWESRVESVKAIRYQAPQIKEALNYLVNSSENAKTRSDAETLATYNLQNFRFLLGMDYREVGFQEAMVETTEIANKMEVEPICVKKRVVHRKRQVDESTGEDVTQSAEENFKNNYLLYIIDQVISSFGIRFQQLQSFEENFGILWKFEKLKSIESEKLRTFCDNLANITNYGENSDLNGDDLYEDVCMLRRNFPDGTKSAIDVLTCIKEMEDRYPNAWIDYIILLTIPVTVAYTERSFSKLKLIKCYLCSTMSQERLSGLAMLSIENDMVEKLNYVNLIDIFASKNARRVIFK
ncbi:uncharacterized protein LOC141679157 [Apium graveolens]|uniref:uncharacterized protein LOC141679157 n=1 Tax=Apium graveolens TaxID=4045 RepID=UPI003D79AAF3